MSAITHNNLPEAVTDLLVKLSRIEKYLNDICGQPSKAVDQMLNVEQAADFLGLSKATIYLKVSSGDLPHMKKSKRLYFSTQELTDYLKSGKRNSIEDEEQGAEQFLTKKRGI